MGALHPLLIHLPIALLLLWPLVDLAGLAAKRADVSLTAFGLLLLALPSSLVATLSGQSAYEAALERGFSPQLLDGHADLAGLVPWLVLALLFARGFGPRRLRPLWISLGLALASMVVWVAKSGGGLVYGHAVGVHAGP
jgi:uncharacterized membrane protein